MDQLLDVGTPIYSIAVSPDENEFALVHPAPEGLALTVREFQQPSRATVSITIGGLRDTTSVVRYLDTGTDLVLFANETLYLVNNEDGSIVEVAKNVCGPSLSNDGTAFGGLVVSNDSLQAKRWRGNSSDDSTTIALGQFTSAETIHTPMIFFADGTRSVAVVAEQLLTIDWEAGHVHSQSFEFAEAEWLAVNEGASMLGVIGPHLKGIRLYTLPELDTRLPLVLSRDASGYTRILFDEPHGHAILGSHVGYITLLHLSNGEREYSEQVHEGRVRDIIVSDGSIWSCGDDGLVMRLDHHEESD